MTRWQALAATALRAVVRAGTREALRAVGRRAGGARPAPRAERRPQQQPPRQQPPGRGRGAAGPAAPPSARRPYPGDFTGRGRIEYTPALDGDPDPGEIVWTWVPFEEDATRGKDRPVLVVGRDDGWLLALLLSSRDHDGPGSDAADEARHGRTWMEIGSGSWDRRGRTSEVR
ncbi:MAG TPA: type II toxin-antitoxin system PemK/MazF family toxin, partial [Actinomycetales bacterium]